MTVAYVKYLGDTSNKTAGTTLGQVLQGGGSAAGNLIVARVIFDNAATASKPVVSSISKMAGETNNWVFLGAARSTSTSAGAFASGEMWCIQTTVAWTGTITVTLDTSVTMKAVLMQEFSGVQAVARSTVGTNYSTTTTAASATTTGTAPVIGDLAIGLIWGSNVAAQMAGDNDTTAGAWSAVAGLGSTGAGAATNNFGVGQYKILTAATHQTYNNSAAMTSGNGSIVATLQAAPDPSITQAAYQFFDDAGTESGAASLAAVNTAITGDITNGDGFGVLRIRLQSTTAVAVPITDDFRLQVELNGGGNWFDVTTISTFAQAYNNANLTDAAATTNRLGAGTGSFVAGKVSETGEVTNQGWTANNYTEFVYSLKIIAAQLVNGSSLRFRVLRNGVTTGMTYTQVPTINIIQTMVLKQGSATTSWAATPSAAGKKTQKGSATTAWSMSLSGAAPPIVKVQSVTNHSGSANYTLALPSNVTVGNHIIVTGATYQDNFVQPTDSRGHTYTQAGAQGSTGNSMAATWFTKVTNAGPCTITTSVSNGAAAAAEFSGLVDSAVLNDSDNTTGSGTTLTAAATGTLPQANCLIIGHCTHNYPINPLTLTEDATFLLLGEEQDNLSYQAFNAQYKITSSTADVTPTWTASHSDLWVTQRHVFLGVLSSGAAAVGKKTQQGTATTTWEMSMLSGAPIFEDDFNRADTMEDLGPDWTRRSQHGWSHSHITSGEVTSGHQISYTWDELPASNAECFAEVDVWTGSGEACGVVLCHSGADFAYDGYSLYTRNWLDKVMLTRGAEGNFVAEWVPDPAVNSSARWITLRLERSGAVLSGYCDGVLLGTWTDPAPLTGNLIGLCAGAANAGELRIDNWSGGGLGAGGTTAIGEMPPTGPPANRGSATTSWNMATATVVYSDDFNRANGSLGANWVYYSAFDAGNLSLVGNHVEMTGEAVTYTWVSPVGSADQWAEADMVTQPTASGSIGPAVRSEGDPLGSSGEFAVFMDAAASDPPTMYIRRSTGYSSAVLGARVQVGGPPGIGPRKVRLEVQGTTLRAYCDGVLYITRTSTAHLEGQPGIFGGNFRDTGDLRPLEFSLDNFRCGTFDVAGADGKRTPKASVTADHTWTPAATGKRFPQGSITAAHSWVPTAAGKKTQKGTATTVFVEALTAAGKKTQKGTATTTWSEALTSAGKRTPKSTVTATWTAVPSAAGKRTPKGSNTATHNWVPAASGVKPSVAARQGFAVVGWSAIATAAGKRTPKSTLTTNYVETVTAAGRKNQNSTVTVPWYEALTAAGRRTPKGTVTAAWTTTPSAVGRRTPQSSITAAHSWLLTAAGIAPIVLVGVRVTEDRIKRLTEDGSERLLEEGAVVPPKLGSAVLSYIEATSAAGKKTPKSAVTTDYAETVTAAGRRNQNSTVTVPWYAALVSVGKRTPKSTGTVPALQTLSSVGRRTPKATSTAIHEWTSSAFGVRPILGVKQGNGLVGISWVPTAVGKRTPKGASTTNAFWTPIAAGKKIQQGSATTTYVETVPPAPGKRTPKGVVTTTTLHTAAGSGRRTSKATSTLVHTWTLVATGFNPLVGVNQGFAIAAWEASTAGTGKRSPKGSTTAAHLWTPSAAGKKFQRGTAAANWSETLTSAGKRIPKASAVTTYAETLSAVGRRASRGAGVPASHSWSLFALGFVPALAQGAGLALTSWSPAAAGKRSPKGAANAAVVWAPAAAGSKNQTATAEFSHLWTPSAEGRRQTRGAALITYVETASAVGRHQSQGSGDSDYRYSPVALGLQGVAGQVEAIWNGQEVVEMQYGDKAVIDWLLVPT